MRVLLDACVPRGLRSSLVGHDVETAHERGWGDLDNGDLLDAMAAEFDALITVDRRLPLQQEVAKRPFGIVVVRAKSNRLADLEPLVAEIVKRLQALAPGEVIEVA
jgi:predicted nuclease of predicted toxin-antitoxin system